MSRQLPLKAANSVTARSRNFRFRSVGRTDRGLVRKLNEDAFIENPDTALWAVADGMGGHNGGDFASAMVIGRLGLRRPTPCELKWPGNWRRRITSYWCVHGEAREAPWALLWLY